MCFEAMSELKINFEKSEAFVTGGDLKSQVRAAHMMKGKLGECPFSYLGLPIADMDFTIADFDPIKELVAVRLEPWQSRYLAAGGGLTLLNSCLSNVPTYAMSFYLLQDGVHNKFDKGRSRFF